LQLTVDLWYRTLWARILFPLAANELGSRGGVRAGWGQVLPRASLPVVAVFRQTLRRFNRTISDEFGIKYSRVSRIERNSVCQRARRKT